MIFLIFLPVVIYRHVNRTALRPTVPRGLYNSTYVRVREDDRRRRIASQRHVMTITTAPRTQEPIQHNNNILIRLQQTHTCANGRCRPVKMLYVFVWSRRRARALACYRTNRSIVRSLTQSHYASVQVQISERRYKFIS